MTNTALGTTAHIPSRRDGSASTHSPPASPPPSRHLLVRLQNEWNRLSSTPSAVHRAQSWGLRVERFDSLDALLCHVGYGYGAGRHDDDEALGQLVAVARGDELAARVVLQRLLPGIASIARRRATSAGSRNGYDTTDEVLAAAWSVIRTYPVDRRPHFVAANILRSINYVAFESGGRRKCTMVPQPMHTFDRRAADELPRSSADELADLLELADAAGLDPGDLELARRLGRGDSTADLARELNVTDRTIRNHRAALTQRLRAVALAAV
jgi:DNA-binding CsgD family transcriptional regulator